MQTLRRIRALACCLLAWFALSLGVATASPFVNPQAMELVCSGAGEVKLIVHTDGDAQEPRVPMLDCPLCIHLGGAAPPPAQVRLPAPQPLAHALRPIPSAHIAARTAAPLPPRGPPLVS